VTYDQEINIYVISGVTPSLVYALILLPLPCLQLEEDFIKANPEWVAELELMLKKKEKAEIQALSSFGFQYLSQVYLPLKLQEGDWI
jgi:hypothetical protein